MNIKRLGQSIILVLLQFYRGITLLYKILNLINRSDKVKDDSKLFQRLDWNVCSAPPRRRGTAQFSQASHKCEPFPIIYLLNNPHSTQNSGLTINFLIKW